MGTPKIVVRELVFGFSVALFDPRLPEAPNGGPVVRVRCLFRLRQQLLENGFLRGPIVPRIRSDETSSRIR
jgi:hypothetical protein